MSDWTLLAKLPIIDIACATAWFWSVQAAWRNAPLSGNEANSIEERTLGASVIMGQLSAIITGVSIIIAGMAAFVALGTGSFSVPQKFFLFWATVWAVVALGLALYTMGVLPTRTPKQNFVYSRDVAKLCALALFFGLFSGVRLTLAVAAFLL